MQTQDELEHIWRQTQILGSFKELPSQMPCFYNGEEKLLLTLTKTPGFGLKHFCQVGNELRFIGVFSPEWGIQFIFYFRK
jgi:hypothetical protein